MNEGPVCSGEVQCFPFSHLFFHFFVYQMFTFTQQPPCEFNELGENRQVNGCYGLNWVPPPPNSYVEGLTPRPLECECIWREDPSRGH